MSTSASILEFAENGFMPISLVALNDKPAMLERIDNKYVVKGPVLAQALPEFCEAFDILEIKSKRSFIYETC